MANDPSPYMRGAFTLARKLAALMAGAGLLVALMSFVLLDQVLSPVFDKIEKRVVNDQVARAEFALENYSNELEEKNLDYAIWTYSYDYVADPNALVRQEMAAVDTLVNLDISFIGITRFDGQNLYNSALDQNGVSHDRELGSALVAEIKKTGVHQMAVRNAKFATYVQVKGSIFALHTTHIFRSDGSGEPSGYHIMASRLRQSDLAAALQVDAQLEMNPGAQLIEYFGDRQQSSLSTVTNEVVNTHLPIRGYDGAIYATIAFGTERTITAAGRNAILLAMAAMTASLLLLAGLIWAGLQHVIVARIEALSAHVSRFDTSRTVLDPRLTSGRDELSNLACEFDELGRKLDNAEDELRRQSYVQGKADSAVGLLHNIRNSLGPLQVKHDKWLAEDRSSYRSQLRRAVDELSAGAEDEREEKLRRFIAQAVLKLTDTGDERSREILELKDSIDQIVAILADYDFDTSKNVRTETMDMLPVIEREIETVRSKLDCELQVEIANEIPPVLGNRIVVSQVVGNVIGNAVDSMRAANVSPMRISVSFSHRSNACLDVMISDNGEGADAATIAQAFERGFSTRKHKSGGAGLHWSANAVKAMGGDLSLQSPGVGKGATAVLTLPAAPASSSHVEHDPIAA